MIVYDLFTGSLCSLDFNWELNCSGKLVGVHDRYFWPLLCKYTCIVPTNGVGSGHKNGLVHSSSHPSVTLSAHLQANHILDWAHIQWVNYLWTFTCLNHFWSHHWIPTISWLYPRPTKLEGGYTGFTLSVCPSVRLSVRPSVCRRHGFRSISQVCFGISISNFICMLMVAIGRSLLIFSDVTFKMAAWRPYWIFWFPDSNFTSALNINFKLQRHNTYVYG